MPCGAWNSWSRKDAAQHSSRAQSKSFPTPADSLTQTDIRSLNAAQARPGFSSRACRALPEDGTSRVLRNTLLVRSEEHTSELQSHSDLVCRLLLEKKK